MDSDERLPLDDFFAKKSLDQVDVRTFILESPLRTENSQHFHNLLVYLLIPKATQNSLSYFQSLADSNNDEFRCKKAIEDRRKKLEIKAKKSNWESLILNESFDYTLEKDECFNMAVRDSIGITQGYSYNEYDSETSFNENYKNRNSHDFPIIPKNPFEICEETKIEKFEQPITPYPFCDNIWKADITYCSNPIKSSVITLKNCIELKMIETNYYKDNTFPKFYGDKQIIENGISTWLIYIEEANEVLKANLMAFWKKKTQEKTLLKNQRILQAIQLLKDLISDMISYKKYKIDHLFDINPENILVYENQNTLGGLKFKLVFTKYCQNYIEDYSGHRLVINENAGKRFLPPETAHIEYYIKKYNSRKSESNPDAGNIWVMAACVLSMVTDRMIDKWNNVNFESSLAAIVIKEFTGYEKAMKILLNCLSLSFKKRPMIENLRKFLQEASS